MLYQSWVMRAFSYSWFLASVFTSGRGIISLMGLILYFFSVCIDVFFTSPIGCVFLLCVFCFVAFGYSLDGSLFLGFLVVSVTLSFVRGYPCYCYPSEVCLYINRLRGAECCVVILFWGNFRFVSQMNLCYCNYIGSVVMNLLLCVTWGFRFFFVCVYFISRGVVLWLFYVWRQIYHSATVRSYSYVGWVFVYSGPFWVSSFFGKKWTFFSNMD